MFAIATTLNMSVVVSGSGPYAYQWYYGSKKIEGATGSGLEMAGMVRANSGTYHVKVSNSIEAVASRDAEVIVDEPISIKLPAAWRRHFCWRFSNTLRLGVR